MKAPLIPALLILTGILLPDLQAEEVLTAPVPKPRPTNEDLLERRAKASSPYANVKGYTSTRATVVRPRDVTTKRDLVSRSTVLTDGRHWTIVPKGSVLTVPERFRSRVDVAPSGELQTWTEFLRRNSGWLFTKSVAMDEARGESAIEPSAVEAFEKTGRVVVAVFQTGPISVNANAFAAPGVELEATDPTVELAEVELNQS
jgi:hypothetical protein